MGTFEVISVVLISVAELALGVACGWWLKERRGMTAEQFQEQFQQMMTKLAEMAHAITDDVDDHSSRMDGIARELHQINRNTQGLGNCVIAVVERIAAANTTLQAKLASTQELMREQAQQLDLHITEARVDVTTELANRRAFNDELSRRYAELQRTGNPFSLLVADIDHFKQINDRYGHDAGDLVLKHVAHALRETVRDMDLVARYGGEEFAILLPMTDWQRATRAAERAREAVENLKFEGALSGTRVTVSVGYSQAVANDSSRDLFSRADMALYDAKASGRNCCRGDRAKTAAEKQAAGSQDDVATSDKEKGVDRLTGLPNRRQLVEELKVSFVDARTRDDSLVLLLIAVDQMERLTSSHDPRQIDQLLLRIATTLTACVRDVDCVIRYGWEEFAVLMPAAMSDDAIVMTTHLRQRLTRELAGCGISPLPTFSTGVAVMRELDDPITFASRAETELDKARVQGGDRTCVDTVEPAAVVASV